MNADPAGSFVPSVDAHAHIFHRTMPLVRNPRHRPSYDFTVESYLAVLDAAGVRYGVIAAASPWGDYNAYTIESVKTHARLRGTVILYPDKEYDFQTMAEAGIVGIRLPFIGLNEIPDITTSAWRRLFGTLADLRWHVHLHVEAAHLPALVPTLLDSGPELVIDHMGRPGPEDRIGDPWFRTIVGAVDRGRTWVKVSCAYRIGTVADEVLRGLLSESDPSRLFWASDCPFVGHEREVTYPETIDWLAKRVGSPDLRGLIFGENAYRFYFGGDRLPDPASGN